MVILLSQYFLHLNLDIAQIYNEKKNILKAIVIHGLENCQKQKKINMLKFGHANLPKIGYFKR